MRIGLYIEHGVGNGVGGAELLMAFLASAWSRTHHVDLIHHRPPLTKDRLQLFTADDLSNVTFRYVPRQDQTPAYRNPIRRYVAARDWHRTVSDGYDCFVNCTHWVPCFCHAPRGLLLVLFPIYIRPDRNIDEQLPWWKRIRHGAYYSAEWRRRAATYQHHIAISNFSRAWTEKRWGLDCDVVYPPVDVTPAPEAASKESLILSVGRFSTMAHTKKQLELMNAFRELNTRTLPRWRYASVGGLNTRPENHAYFEQVKHAASGCSAVVQANLEREEVRALFQRARIFWHATGFNDQTVSHPELAEHFGISTVEAMAAGCVPVVVNKGGQPEIVEHGISGFVWNTIEELKTYTHALAEDRALWTRMSEAAKRRAQAFSRERFLIELSSRLGLKSHHELASMAKSDTLCHTSAPQIPSERAAV
jgi:glycosyltransferase involved in cell wall biosynthesis